MGIETKKHRKRRGVKRGGGLSFGLFLALAFTFAACGNDDDDDSSDKIIHDDDNNNNIINNHDNENDNIVINDNDNHNNDKVIDDDDNVAGSELFLPLTVAPISAQTQSFVPLLAENYKNVTSTQSNRIDSIKKIQTTKSVSLTRIDINAFNEDSVLLSLPSNQKLRFIRKHFEAENSNNFKWSGRIPGTFSSGTFVVRNGNVTANIQDENLESYHIEPIGDGVHALIHIDKSTPSVCGNENEMQSNALSTTVGMLKATAPVAAIPLAAPTAENPVDIDVMVAFTPAARAAYSDMAALIDLAITEANHSYKDSGVHIRLNLVDSFEFKSQKDDCDWSNTCLLKVFPRSEEVKNRRDGSGADVAILIYVGKYYGICGEAATLLADAGNAFAVVEYSCIRAGDYTFAHEIGHLQGAQHDEKDSPWGTYDHGYIHPSEIRSESFSTIMATSTSCLTGPYRTHCPRIPYWSNPNIFYNGIAMGTAELNNNARMLNETAQMVAGFRPSGYAYATGVSRMNVNTRLGAGNYLISPNGQYQLMMQNDGNLVLSGPGNQALWWTATQNNPGAYALLQSNGNLGVYGASVKSLWATNTNGKGVTSLELRNDGTLVLLNNAGQVVWQNRSKSMLRGPVAQMFAGQSLVSPNGQYQLLMQNDGNLVLSGPGKQALWYTATQNNPGAYMALNGDFAVWKANGTGVHWKLGISGATSVELRDNGTLVLLNNNGQEVWQHRSKSMLRGPVAILLSGQSLASSDGKTELSMQANGDLKLHTAPITNSKNGTTTFLPWSSGTNANPGAYMALQSDGNLVVWNASGTKALWSAGVSGATRLEVQYGGVLVLLNNAGQEVWRKQLVKLAPCNHPKGPVCCTIPPPLMCFSTPLK